MAIFRSKIAAEYKRPPLTDADYISPNITSGNDQTYSPTPFKYTVPSNGGSRIERARERLLHFYRKSIAPFWGTFFYERYRYYFQSVEFKTGLSLGAISSERNITISVFSAFKDKNIVTSISLPVDSGITVTNLSVGDRVQPYSLFPVDLNIAKDGSVVVNGDIVVSFSNGRSWVINISLVRVTLPVSLLEANWAEGVTASRSFLTDVFVGADMSQSRKSLRKIPVRRQSVSLLFRDRESALRAWAASRTSVSDPFYFPIITDVSVMSDVNDGNKIFCSTAYRRFEAGQFVLLIHAVVTGDASGDIYGHQVFQVASVDVDGITLTGAGLESYGAGDLAYPMMRCLPNAGSASFKAFTRQKGLLTMEVVEEWGTSSLPLENALYSPTIRYGLPLFDFRVNEASDTSMQIMQGGQTVESGRGFEISQYGEPYQSQSIVVLAEDREAYWNLTGFFNYVRGRARPFWMRQYLDTFTLLEQDGDYYRFQSDLNASDLSYIAYLWVEDAAGNKDIVKVLGVVNTVEGFDILCSTSTIVTDAVTVYQALAVVQASDSIEENWLTASVVEISFTVEESQGSY